MTAPLSDRQRAVLAAVAAESERVDQTRNGPRLRYPHGVPAFKVADALVAAGLQRPGVDRGYATGAANTLLALARRGLVSNKGSGGCYVSCDWQITDAGRAAMSTPGGAS